MSHNQQFGKRGEDMAASFFKNQGYEIVERNWRCRFGEVDLIIKCGEEWRFVEVKARQNEVFGYPEEAVTAVKREHFYKAIEIYSQMRGLSPRQVHADVLAIVLSEKDFDVRWLKDAV